MGGLPSQVLGGGGLPAATYLLPSRTPHPRDSGLQGEGRSGNKGVFVPSSWGAGVELASISPRFLSVAGALQAQPRSFPRWGAELQDPRAQVRARRPGPPWAFAGSTERRWGCPEVSLQEKEGTKPGRRRVQSAALAWARRPGSSSFCCHPPHFLAWPHPLHALAPRPCRHHAPGGFS